MLSQFPLFISLTDKNILVVGGGNIATRRVKTLLLFTDNIRVIAPKISDEIMENSNNIEIIQRKFKEEDIEGKHMVLATTDNRDLNRKIAEICKDKNIMVNVCDDKSLCDFYFPAIFTDGDIIGGLVSNKGENHKLVKEKAQEIRKLLKGDIVLKKIRIGSRDSKLALIQTEIVAKSIKEYDSTIEIEIVKMKTTGDKILDKTLDKIGGKGLFVKELDEALLSGAVDITVHSFKDLPMEINPDLPIVAISEREDPRDVIIYREDKIGPTSLIGCSSKRRTIQLNEMGYSNIKPLRGNVQTRLKKLEAGEYDAIVLAAAGLKRLDQEDIISRYFTVEEMLPSACQGVLAVQGKIGESWDYLSNFHNKDVETTSIAERAYVRELDGGCSSPIAAYAVLNGDEINITGLYVDEEKNIYRDSINGSRNDAEKLGTELAKKIKEMAK